MCVCICACMYMCVPMCVICDNNKEVMNLRGSGGEEEELERG